MKNFYRIFSLVPILLLAILAGCQPEEMVKAPEFAIAKGDEPVLDLVQGGQYEMEGLLPFMYGLAGNKDEDPTTKKVAAERFTVTSNLSWRIVSAEDTEYDWIRPFPDRGEDDGQFVFLVEQNTDQENPRTAYFKVIANDGMNDMDVPGMITVTQLQSGDFLVTSAAMLEVNNNDTKKKSIIVNSNLPWSYEIEPYRDYATEDTEWLSDITVHPAGQTVDTIAFHLADNSSGSIRGAVVRISCEKNPDFNKEILVTQYGADVEINGFPVQWIIATLENNYNTTFPAAGTISATTGTGLLSYVPDPGKSDPDGKFAWIVGATGDPYVTGAWPGDYWEFKASTPVASGTILKITFEAATSATGHKYWRLEYKDGDQWKVVGAPQTVSIEGQDTVTYTHTMLPDSKQKVKVSGVVKYTTSTDEAVFRFVCAANDQSSGNGPLTKPNGGTMRLGLTDVNSTEWQPTITCVAAGSEELVSAEISVTGLPSNGIITFEGTPEAPYRFNVTSDEDFNVTSTVSWLTVKDGAGLAGETKEISLECAASELPTLRQGTVEIVSGITKRVINVIQSAEGQELEPFISIVGGNTLNAKASGESIEVKVQANTEYSVEMSDWIEEVQVPETKALVEVKSHGFTILPNSSGAERYGFIRFIDNEGGLESVLNVHQAYSSINVLYYESFTGNANNTKVPAIVPTKEGSGVSALNYTGGTNVDIRNTYAQGSGSYLDYDNGLYPDNKGTSGAHLYIGTGTYNSAESWFQINDISLSGEEALRFGLGVFGIDPDKKWESVPAPTTLPLYYRFDNQSEWTLLQDIRFNYNWQWISLPAIAVPAGAAKVNFRFEALTSNYVRVDDFTLVEASLSEVPGPLDVQWQFTADDMSAYSPTFNTPSSDAVKAGGSGGAYVSANLAGTGRIEYYSIDKSSLDTDGKFERTVGSTGHPFVTGAWPGDYWLFTATNGLTYKAGSKFKVKYESRISATGQKYWIIEYKDGEEWKPVRATQMSTDIIVDGADKNVEYNVALSTNSKANTVVEEEFTISVPMTTLQFRMRCVANWQGNGSGELSAPNGGTCPVFKAVE